MASDRAQAIEAWAPWAAGALLAFPVIAFRYPPMGDLAPHEAIVAILRHFGDTRLFPPGLYELSLGQPNQLFHGTAWLLSLVVPTDTACKIVVAATVFGTPIAAARLASHLGVTRWTAMLVAPLAVGWMFRWGLVANMMGFALWLAALPALDRLARDPTPRRAMVASSLAVLLYFGHESSMAMYAIACLVLAVQSPRSARSLGLVACPGAVAVLLAALYDLRSEPLKAPSILAVGEQTTPLIDKITGLPGALYSAAFASVPLLVASALAIGLLGSSRGGTATATPSLLDRVIARRFAVLAAVLFALYLSMPLTWGGSTLIHQRFLAPAIALAALAAAPPGKATPAWTAALGAFPVAMLALTLPAFSEQARSYRDLDAVLEHVEDGSAVAQLDLTPRGPTRMAPVVGAASRALAVHGGRLLFSFTDAPALPVKIPARMQWNEPVLRVAPAPFAFMPSHDLRRFRYALVYERVRAMDGPLAESFAPEARLVAKAGNWLLFESNLPLVPLTAPDAPLPQPAPETLADRVRRALKSAPSG